MKFEKFVVILLFKLRFGFEPYSLVGSDFFAVKLNREVHVRAILFENGFHPPNFREFVAFFFELCDYLCAALGFIEILYCEIFGTVATPVVALAVFAASIDVDFVGNHKYAVKADPKLSNKPFAEVALRGLYCLHERF